ncbi:MAG: hypothetical protein WCP95_02225 [Actinomycetes bacterium]
MPYLLAAVALIAPIVLVIQTIRGRVRVQSCCAVPADRDLRLRTTAPDEGIPVDRA